MWARRDDREREFTDYVTARHAHLWRIAYALTGARDRADDLLQVALEKLYVAWPRLRDRDQPDAYVRRILVLANIDEARRPWRREVVSETAGERRTSPDPTGVVDVREQLGRVLRALPPMQRRCVVLRHLLDLSVSQTALELGISEGAVKQHTSRAIASLQGLLSEPVHPGA